MQTQSVRLGARAPLLSAPSALKLLHLPSRADPQQENHLQTRRRASRLPSGLVVYVLFFIFSLFALLLQQSAWMLTLSPCSSQFEVTGLQYMIKKGLDARQVGGRPIPADCSLWKELLPSGRLRVTTRRPVEDSVQSLLQSMEDPTCELIAVAFSPRPGFTSPAIFELLLSGFAKIKYVFFFFGYGGRSP